MANLELHCYAFIPSCLDCGTLVAEGETVFIHTVPGRYTDAAYGGQIQAEMKVAYKECDQCYEYLLEFDEADLPEGIAGISQCDVLKIGCEGCPPLTLNISAGCSPTDQSGGTGVTNGNIHFWSESAVITITGDGEVRIECDCSPYPYGDPASW